MGPGSSFREMQRRKMTFTAQGQGRMRYKAHFNAILNVNYMIESFILQ